MNYKDFSSLIEAAPKSGQHNYLGVIAPNEAAVEAAKQAERLGLATAVFFEGSSAAEAAANAVSAVKRGEIQMLIKGNIDTAMLMKAILHPHSGLSHDQLLSHLAMFSLPSYAKLIALTDGGLVIRPTFEEKKGILQNAISAIRKLGITRPKVACLSAIETVNPKMADTVDARHLKELGDAGFFGECIIEGPISLDLALSHHAAEVKNFYSEVAGDADLLFVPDITAGNLLGKSLVYTGNAEMAGVILGTQCPVIVTSRVSSANERLNSIALAALLAAASD
jgi:phosphate butyryltransferase